MTNYLKINAYNITGHIIPPPTTDDAGKFVYFDGQDMKWDTRITSVDMTEITCNVQIYYNQFNSTSYPKLRKVYIPSTLSSFLGGNAINTAPFLGCLPTVKIYTDIEDAAHVPVSWGQYWNNYDENNKLQVYYNTSYAEYKEK